MPLLQLPRVLGTSAFLTALSFEVMKLDRARLRTRQNAQQDAPAAFLKMAGRDGRTTRKATAACMGPCFHQLMRLLWLQVLVLSGVSAYLGLLLGFGMGSWGMVHMTWNVGRRLLRLGRRRIHPVLALLP